MKPFDKELITGSILRSVWKLSWPMVLLNMVNGIHGFVDQALVGHYVPSADSAANAGVGIAWSAFLVIVVFISSLYAGMNAFVARYAGKHDRVNVSRVAYQTFLASVTALGIIAPVGYLLAPQILMLIKTSPAEMVHALPYLRILFVFGMPVFLMFMVTGAMQSSGDPRTPLLLGVLATILNVVLSYILITGAGPFPAMGAAGAALATCIAPFVSVLIALGLILRGKTIIQPPPRGQLWPDFSVIRPIMRKGFPVGIQAVLLNIGGIVLLRFMGGLEHHVAARAAYIICYSQLFSLATWPAYALRGTATTILGQNMGAGLPERGRRGVYVTAAAGAVWAAFMALVYWVLPVQLLDVFNASDEMVRHFGIVGLRYLAGSGICLMLALVFTGALVGAGDTVRPMVIAFISQIGVLLGLCILFWYVGLLTMPVIWACILISHFVRLLLTYLVFVQGRWQHIRLELEREKE